MAIAYSKRERIDIFLGGDAGGWKKVKNDQIYGTYTK